MVALKPCARQKKLLQNEITNLIPMKLLPVCLFIFGYVQHFLQVRLIKLPGLKLINRLVKTNKQLSRSTAESCLEFYF